MKKLLIIAIAMVLGMSSVSANDDSVAVHIVSGAVVEVAMDVVKTTKLQTTREKLRLMLLEEEQNKIFPDTSFIEKLKREKVIPTYSLDEVVWAEKILEDKGVLVELYSIVNILY